MSKLGVLVRLKTSKLYFRETRSLIFVFFTMDMSARRCQAWRKILRWPVVKLVSKVSPGGIAPFRSPGARSGSVKHCDLSAYCGLSGVPNAPDTPVSAFFGVQPGANGTMGLVMPSLTP